MNVPVLVDEDVWPDFGSVIEGLGGSWTAPSGRRYAVALNGKRLEVSLVVDGLQPHPAGADVDADLLELGCQVMDGVGGEWSGENLRRVAQVWAAGSV